MFGHLLKHGSRTVDHLKKRKKKLAQTPSLDGKHFLFIGGLHRSGTSILHRLLREHPSTSGFHDTGVPEDEGQHLQSVFAAAHEYGGPGEFAFHLDAHLTESSPLISPDNTACLLREWGAYYDLEKKVLLEKSPPNLVRSRFFRELLPGSRFVFIVRHPIAVSLATEKWSRRTIIEQLLHWQVAHTIMLADIQNRADCLVIRYEDFVAQPQRYLDEICQLSGIATFSPGEAVSDHNEKYFAAWQQRYARDTATLQAIFPADSPVLEKFNYTLTPPFIHR